MAFDGVFFGHFPDGFVVAKLDIYYKMLRIIVATLQDIINEMLGHYPAVLVAPNGIFLTMHDNIFQPVCGLASEHKPTET